jgi:hypothetical protein
VTGVEQSMPATCVSRDVDQPNELTCLGLAAATELFNLGGYSDLSGSAVRLASPLRPARLFP